jgi:hypothetical protein
MMAKSPRTVRAEGEQEPPQRASVNAVTQQPLRRSPPHQQMPCCLGANMCRESHPLEKCVQFKKMSPEQQVMKVNDAAVPSLYEALSRQGVLHQGQGRLQGVRHGASPTAVLGPDRGQAVSSTGGYAVLPAGHTEHIGTKVELGVCGGWGCSLYLMFFFYHLLACKHC